MWQPVTVWEITDTLYAQETPHLQRHLSLPSVPCDIRGGTSLGEMDGVGHK